jgi:hypothetical protein
VSTLECRSVAADALVHRNVNEAPLGDPQASKNAADPTRESAAVTAVAGMPPQPHERDAVIVARSRSLDTAPIGRRYTKWSGKAGPHGLCEAPEVSETRDFGRPRAPACLTPSQEYEPSLTGRAAPRPSPPGLPAVGHGEKRGSRNRQEGSAPPIARRGLVIACERDSGRLAARRMHLIGRRLSAPTPGTSVPLPGPARGC